MGLEYVYVADLAKLEAAGNKVQEHVNQRELYDPELDDMVTDVSYTYSMVTPSGEELFVGMLMPSGNIVQLFYQKDMDNGGVPEALMAGAKDFYLSY